MRTGATNTLVDVPAFRVGHATRDERGWLTGTTCVLAPEGGAVGGVDVRGGGPGTRETDLLDPRNMVDRVDAVVLTGGSALGLAAVDGVVSGLLDDERGWPMGEPGQVVPIVPAAVIFDLGRGGGWRNHPGPAEGRLAYERARDAGRAPVELGCVGAGTGAKAGGVKGGIGSASVVLPDGTTVAALVVCNAVGSVVDPATGRLYADLDEAADVQLSPEDALRAAGPAVEPLVGGATTIGVVATDAALTKAQCQKLAGIGHDGLARAIRPVHTYFDGDTLFALAAPEGRARPLPELAALFEAGAVAVERAVARAVLAATPVDRTADGGATWVALSGLRHPRGSSI